MKKIILASLFATSVFASEATIGEKVDNDLSGKITVGALASFGVEGLDFNLDQPKTISLVTNYFREGGSKSDSLPKLIQNIKHIESVFKPLKEDVSNSNDSSKPNIEKDNNKDNMTKEIISLIGKNLIFDTYLSAQLHSNFLKTMIGADVFVTELRIGDDFKKQFRFDRAVIRTDTNSKYIKMKNRFYIGNYGRKPSGFDKFRYDYSVPKHKFQFDSQGLITPLQTIITPELKYDMTFSKEKKEFMAAPMIALQHSDNEYGNFRLSAGYLVSNRKAYKFTNTILNEDAPKLAPGNRKVEYFKNWELCKKRDITKGCVDGTKTSKVVVGLPTGALYSELLNKVVIHKAFNEILAVLPQETQNLIKSAIRNRKMTLDDINVLLKDVSQFKELEKVFKDDASAIAFLQPVILDILKELGIKDDSSFALTNLIPEDLGAFITRIKNISTATKDGKSAEKSAQTDVIPSIELPDEEIALLTEILQQKEFFDHIGNIMPIAKDLEPYIKDFQNQDQKLKEIEQSYAQRKKECDKKPLEVGRKLCRWHIKNLIGFEQAGDVLSNLKDLAKDSIEVKNVIKKYKEEIKVLLSDADRLLNIMIKDESLAAEKQKIKSHLDGVNSAFTLMFDKNNITEGFKKFIETFTEIKNLVKFEKGKIVLNENNTMVPIKKVLESVSKDVLTGVDNIIYHPEQVRGFDWLASAHIVDSEQNQYRKRYANNLIKAIGDIKDSNLAHGFTIDAHYNSPSNAISSNVNVDVSWTKYLHQIDSHADIGIHPVNLDAEVAIDVQKSMITHPKIKYEKLHILPSVYLGANLTTHNNAWSFRPGIGYVGEYEQVKHIAGGVPVNIYKRDKKGNLVKKDGKSLDISKISKYEFDKNEIAKEIKYGGSGWEKPTHYVVPSFGITIRPTNHLELDYNIKMPIQVKGSNFGGVLLQNNLELSIKF